MNSNYKRLKIFKEFPRWNEEEYPYYRKDVLTFIEKYDDNQFSLKPVKNPISDIIFDTRQGPFDIYQIYGGFIKRGFIISNKLLVLLKDYNLGDHVIFEGIRYRIKGELRNDMNFIYFYDNYDRYVDFSKSTYWVLKELYHINKDNNGNITNDYIYKDNISLGSYEEYREKTVYYLKKNNSTLSLKHVYCSKIAGLDMFSMRYGRLSSGVFVSKNLQERIKKEKIKGVEYSNNIYYDFMNLKD